MMYAACYGLAKLLDSEKRWSESGELFKQLISRTSTAVEPRLAYAQMLVHQGQWHDASLAYRQVVELAPGNDDILMEWCEVILADETESEAARHQQLQEILEKQLVTAASKAPNYLRLAARLQRFGLEARALEWLEKAYRAQPDDFGALTDYARALFAQGHEPEVQAILRDFQAKNLTNRDALAQLADLHWDMANPTAAIECLSKACQLNPTSSMRFRLTEWLKSTERLDAALQQMELAWADIATQTNVASEQETLCEEVLRREIELLRATSKLANAIKHMQVTPASELEQKQPALAGMSSASVVAWRLSKLLMAVNQWSAAETQVSQALKNDPNSVMLWRLRAELEDQAQRGPEIVEARRKLAELDVRRRSEHLFLAARALARLGRVEAALQLTNSITTETASSQSILLVFELAQEHHATKFAMDLLEKRLQARPGDVDVLQRLIRYYLDQGAYQRAAEYQWRNLELMRTTEHRLAAVELLIETHNRLRTLDELEAKLEKYWRQHDLWREFGVWQTLIALARQEFRRAEVLLERLARSPNTRRFALTQSLKLAQRNQQSARQLALMKQLAALDSQEITAMDVGNILSQLRIEERTNQLLADALGLMRGPGKRLGLVQELLESDKHGLALGIIDVMPPEEQKSWPVIARAAVSWAAVDKRPAPENQPWKHYVQRIGGLLDRFVEGSLELPPELSGEVLLKQIVDADEVVLDAAVVCAELSALLDASATSVPAGSSAPRCQSSLQAYAVVLLSQLEACDSPAARRALIDKHRQAALAQTELRERSARLAVLSLTSQWQTQLRTARDARQRISNPAQSFSGRLKSVMVEKRAASDSSLAGMLNRDSEAFQYFIADFEGLTEQGDSLAALLSLWSVAAENSTYTANDGRWQTRAARYYRALGDYAPFAPAKLITLLALAELKENPGSSEDYLRSLSKLAMGKTAVMFVLQKLIAQKDWNILKVWVVHQPDKALLADALGELLSSREALVDLDATTVWQILDAIWQDDVQRGFRDVNQLRASASGPQSLWVSKLPQCSIAMRECSLFTALDFHLIRAILVRAPTSAQRKALLEHVKQATAESTDANLTAVRGLAQIFVLELLEQDAESSRLLEQLLPSEGITDSPSKVALRGLWLEVTGQRDAALEWYYQHDQWPDELQASMASALLALAMERHHDAAIALAVKRLRAARSQLGGHVRQATELIKRGLLNEAEQLLGEFDVQLATIGDPYEISSQFVKTSGPEIVAWALRWQQTDLLVKLLQKYSAADEDVSAFRVAERLIGGVNRASDDEFLECTFELVERLQESFKSTDQLQRFIKAELEQIEQDPTSRTFREMICLLRLISEYGESDMATPLIKHLTVGDLPATTLLELALCQVRLNQLQDAARLYVRAIELEPDRLDKTIGQWKGRAALELLATELDRSSNPGAGVGYETMDALIGALSAEQLAAKKALLLGWAENSRPKTAAHMTQILKRVRYQDFNLWLDVLERLFQSKDLSPMVVAFTNAQHWANRNVEPGALEYLLFSNDLTSEQDTQYQAMLQRVTEGSSNQFVAQLLLLQRLLENKNTQAAGDRVRALIRDSAAQSVVKPWQLSAWQQELAKSVPMVNPNTRNTGNAARRPAAPALSAAEVDKAAKIKLIKRLNYPWGKTELPAEDRALLLKRLAELVGAGGLAVTQQDELLNYYLNSRDSDGVLQLFGGPSGVTLSPLLQSSLTINEDRLKALVAAGMQWEKMLILVRTVQETPWSARSRIVSEVLKSIPADELTPEIVGRLLKEGADTSELMDTQPGMVTTWRNCFKPVLGYDDNTKQPRIDSVLDAWWPLGKPAPSGTEDLVRNFLREQSAQLDSQGPWQLLWTHNVAARVGDERLVKRCQTRMLTLARSRYALGPAAAQAFPWPIDDEWSLACWSAVMASARFKDVAKERLALGEIARFAVARQPVDYDTIFWFMTRHQFNQCSANLAVIDNVLASKDTDLDFLRAGMAGSATQPNLPPMLLWKRVSINLFLCDHLIAQEQLYEPAIDLLISMQHLGWIGLEGNYIVPAITSDQFLGKCRVALADDFQRLIQAGWQPELMQHLLERLLLYPVTVQKASALGMGITPSSPRDISPVAEELIEGLKWGDYFDANRTIEARPARPNLMFQLIELAKANGSLPSLESKLQRRGQRRSGLVVASALLAVAERKLDTALSEFDSLTQAKGAFAANDEELAVVADAIFNEVRQEPLGAAAEKYSLIALERPLNRESLLLIRQQFALAAAHKIPLTMRKLAEKLSQRSIQNDSILKKLVLTIHYRC